MPTIPYSQRKSALNAYTRNFVDALNTLDDNMYSGKITLGMWEEDIRTRIRMYLYGSALIGAGNPPGGLTKSEKGWIGSELKKQYRWLHGFAQDIYARKDSISLEAIRARSHLYSKAGSKVANRMMTPVDLLEQLPWIPGDGTTRCLNMCGCEWILEEVSRNEDNGTKVIRAIWTLHPEKEHCEDCEPRQGRSVLAIVPIDTEIPPFIGLGG